MMLLSSDMLRKIQPIREQHPGLSTDLQVALVVMQEMEDRLTSRINSAIASADALYLTFLELADHAATIPSTSPKKGPAPRKKQRAPRLRLSHELGGRQGIS